MCNPARSCVGLGAKPSFKRPVSLTRTGSTRRADSSRCLSLHVRNDLRLMNDLRIRVRPRAFGVNPWITSIDCTPSAKLSTLLDFASHAAIRKSRRANWQWFATVAAPTFVRLKSRTTSTRFQPPARRADLSGPQYGASSRPATRAHIPPLDGPACMDHSHACCPGSHRQPADPLPAAGAEPLSSERPHCD